MEANGISLLLIEDNEGIAILTRDSLQRAGYRVEVAFGAKKGLERAHKTTFDVILVDHSMPEMSGLEFFEELKKFKPEAICIMVTGTGDEEIAVRAIKSGMYDYIVKSVNNSHLSALPHVIENSLELQRIRVERERLQREAKERNQQLEEANTELQRQLHQLESSHKIMVGREIDMIELKKEINDLLRGMGKPEKYTLPPRMKRNVP